MNPGRMRHTITIQRPVKAQDASTGELTVTWEDVKTSEPAEVLMGAGKEFIQSGAIQSDTDARVTVRYFSGLTQSMRILWDGRIYNIKTYTADRTARRYYFIECGDEGVNEG